MDVDEKDEYEIISQMEKPSNFLTQRDVENEEPERIGVNMHTRENIAGLEVKRPSRWDVGSPFCVQLNDALASNTNETIGKKCTVDLDVARNGACNKTTDENERKKIFANDGAVLKIVSTKMEGCTSQSSNCVDLSLDSIALPCDPCDIALPPEVSSNDSCALLPCTADLASEAILNKEKVVIKWKFTKTPKELPTGDVKIWEPEVELRDLPKLCFKERPKTILEYAETSAVFENSNSDTGRNLLHTKSLIQQSSDPGEIVIPQCFSKPKSSSQSEATTASSAEQNQSDYVMNEMQVLEKQWMKQKAAPQEGKEQLRLSVGSNCNSVSESVLSYPNLQYNPDLKANSVRLVDNETTAIVDSVERTVASWFAMHFPQEHQIKEAKLPSESVYFLQRQGKTDAPKTETNEEGEQESSVSSVSSATSISMYSFNSTPKILPSLDHGYLRTSVGRKQIEENATTINIPTDSNVSTNKESLLSKTMLTLNGNKNELNALTIQVPSVQLAPISQPAQYEHLDENIILCDESLIKEAKVSSK